MERPVSPTFSEAFTTFTEVSVFDKAVEPVSPMFDSSFLLRITMNDCTILAGRPMLAPTTDRPAHAGYTQPSYAVIQLRSNALIMFQSIENPDATGTKTLHISVENVSASVGTKFDRISNDKAAIMIEPTGAEFRVAYSTEKFGCIVSQDISIDCDTVRSSLTPADLSIVANISKIMFTRLRAFNNPTTIPLSKRTRRGVGNILRYQKKGTGIATRVRAEIQSFSFILLRAYKSQFGAPQFLDFKVEGVKCLLEGCVSAMSGDCSANTSINLLNGEVQSWEYVAEPCSISFCVEQMPNEVVSALSLVSSLISFATKQVLSIAPCSPVQLNLTGRLLRELAEMQYDLSRHDHFSDSGDVVSFPPAVLSTVGLRQATMQRAVAASNRCGLDLVVAYEDQTGLTTTQRIPSGKDGSFSTGCNCVQRSDDLGRFSVKLTQSSALLIGERAPINILPLPCSKNYHIYLLKPTTTISSLLALREEALRERELAPGQPVSPVFAASTDDARYHAEPVIERCMQNQRLKSSVVDVFSLPKGRDLLSSQIWSPEDESCEGTNVLADFFMNQSSGSTDYPEVAAGDVGESPTSPQHVVTTTSCHLASKSHWSKPYLKTDVPEWTDMTCTRVLSKEQVQLPNSQWTWADDWTIERGGKLGENIDADGWSYEVDFESFSRQNRYYRRGDQCRRRCWTRTRILRPPKLGDPLQTHRLVWQLAPSGTDSPSILIRSHVQVINKTSLSLNVYGYSPSWDNDVCMGNCDAGCNLHVPIPLSSALYMRLGRSTGQSDPKSLSNGVFGERFSVIPNSHTSSKFVRTSIELKDVSSTTLHFLVEVRSVSGIVDIIVEPVFKLINLLPCQLDVKIGHMLNTTVVKKSEDLASRRTLKHKVSKTEALIVPSGDSISCNAVNPSLKPHLAMRVPGYEWSKWKRIVNRKVDSTWRSVEGDEEMRFSSNNDEEYADELKMLVKFTRLGGTGDPLVVVASVTCGHCPVVRVYAQYWIVDRTGFGCCFSESFADILGTEPDPLTLRRSYLRREESKIQSIKDDMCIPGYQWSLGSSGVSLYFSQKEKLALAVQVGATRIPSKSKGPVSKWISPIDISNVIPKTVFYVDELHGQRRFELAINVTICPGCFGRTKLISLFPRYQVVNLLHRELIIGQDGCLGNETLIPSRSSMHFHWENASLPPKVRLGAPTAEERARRNYSKSWTIGRLHLDRVGITALRLPKHEEIPMVVQAEVRLATKDQPCAVAVVVWSSSEKSYPLYTLRNSTNHTIFCRQPLQDEEGDFAKSSAPFSDMSQATDAPNSNAGYECGPGFGPIVRSFLGMDRIEEFVWVLKPKQSLCFGFDDPEKLHILEWTFASPNNAKQTAKKAFVEVDAMGSSSSLSLPGSPSVKCTMKAEHSTKVIEFAEITEQPPVGLPSMRQTGLHFHEILDSQISMSGSKSADEGDDDESVTVSIRVDIPTLCISVVDDVEPSNYGREILLVQFERTFLTFSQTREGYQEFEARLLFFQVDNHVHKSIHPVMVRIYPATLYAPLTIRPDFLSTYR